MLQIFWFVLFLGTPAVLVLWAHRSRIAAKIGPIVLCYIAGLLLGLSGLLPEAADGPRVTVMEASLGLALPLLLFSVDVPAWRRMAGRAMLAMGLAVAAVTAIATMLYYLFSQGGMEKVEHLSAMAAGMYTGGIANLGAMKLALGIADDTYLIFATLDTVIGAVYLLFVLTLAPRVLAKVLPVQPTNDGPASQLDAGHIPASLSGWIGQGSIAVLASGLCVGAAVSIAPLIPGGNPQILTIVLITSFALALSFVPLLRGNRAATPIGMYLIYVFSLCVAAAMDLGELGGGDLGIFAFVLLATFGSFALHATLCRLFQVDRDTFLVTSVAAIMSPAFVPLVVRSLGAPALLMSGMAAGIVGFAIGNYLGITLALLLA